MKKIINIIKWLGILFIGGFVILLTSIYISSLSSYKESDFNIPDDFFDTRSSHLDSKTQDNGFKILVDFINVLDNEKETIGLLHFDKKSKCIFEKNNCGDSFNIDSEEKYQNLLEFYNNEYQDFLVLRDSIFIKEIKEYNLGSKGKKINYTNLLQFFRGSRYVSYRYFENGDYQKGLDLLLNNQAILDNLTSNSDFDMLGVMLINRLNKINLDAIKYILENYELQTSETERIKDTLLKVDNIALVENGIKHELKNIGIDLNNLGMNNLDIESVKIFATNEYLNLELLVNYTLFFSEGETSILLKKALYDIIQSRGLEQFKVDVNINNMGGRTYINDFIPSYIYKGQFEEESNLIVQRKNLLNILKVNNIVE